MTKGISLPLAVGLTIGIGSILVTVIIIFNFYSPSTDTTAPQDNTSIVEHKYTSLLGDLGDDVIWILPGQPQTFSYTLDHNRDDNGLMTGFIQLMEVNATTSSVIVMIGNASSPSYYHQIRLTKGEIKQIELIIPNTGSVTFQNRGKDKTQIKFNLQLTYFAVYKQ